MAIKVISAKQFATKLKVTIQATGRLGFTEETAKALELTTGKGAKFAQDDETGTLFLVITDEVSEDAFPIKISSGYFYVPTKLMFDMLGLDYDNNSIMFDLIREKSLDEELHGQVYRMKKRMKLRKNNDDSDE